MSTLVIRFSSLGDVVLAGAVTGALAPVHFLTHPRWAPVAAALPGVEKVLRWGEDAIEWPYERVIDLHASPRARWLTLGRGARHVQRHSLRRRLRVAFKVGAPPPRVVERYARAAGVPVAPLPWIDSPGPHDALILCPGAAWATKRWPQERWIGLGRRWTGPVLVLGSAGERALIRAVVGGVGSRAEGIAEAGFDRTLAALGRGAVAVAGDTGLQHLCAAAGVPVVGLFGPTTSADGFWLGAGRAVELDLGCRPCSRHGSDRCPFGDHACMEHLDEGRVWRAVVELRGAP